MGGGDAEATDGKRHIEEGFGGRFGNADAEGEDGVSGSLDGLDAVRGGWVGNMLVVELGDGQVQDNANGEDV